MVSCVGWQTCMCTCLWGWHICVDVPCGGWHCDRHVCAVFSSGDIYVPILCGVTFMCAYLVWSDRYVCIPCVGDRYVTYVCITCMEWQTCVHTLCVVTDMRTAKFVRWSHSQVVWESLDVTTRQPSLDQSPWYVLTGKHIIVVIIESLLTN